MAKQLPTLDIDVRPYADGSVSASLKKAPVGDIWARDEATLLKGMTWLMETIIKQEQRRKASGNSQGAFGNGMQGVWIEGEFVVRWLPIPGFGVAFPSEGALRDWLKELLNVAIKAARVKA